MKGKDLFSLVSYFFLHHLQTHRGSSPNTISAYKDALRLFLAFVAAQNKKKTSRLCLDDISSDLVLAFLASIEHSRKNKIRTRNHRLAILRVFFSFLLMHDPERSHVYNKILKIPLKRGPAITISYLEPKEVSAILDGIDTSTRLGHRDFTMLLLLYNTGARVQEVCDLKIGSFDFGKSPHVKIIGKGNKSRTTPIWEKTRTVLLRYIESELPALPEQDQYLFFNYQKTPLTRHGILNIIRRRVAAASVTAPSLKKKQISPHTFRHTTAMHLLQAGVDLNVIKEWLGHADVKTTNGYVEFNLKMKEHALLKKKPPRMKQELNAILKENRDIVQWLKERG